MYEGELDNNKLIEVDIPTPTFKRVVGVLPTLKKKPQTSPSSLSSDLTELSQLKREQMVKNDNYQKMQFGLEQRKVELLEHESTIEMEKLKAEAARMRLHNAKEQVQLKAERGCSYLEKVCHKMKSIVRCQCLNTQMIVKHTNFIITSYI